MRRVLAILVVTVATQAALAGEAAFSAKPAATKDGDKVKISFTVSAPTDVEVAVLDPQGKVIRHLVAGVLGSSWFSVRLGGWAIARFGRSDPRPFVLDEFAGQWTALLALPVSYHAGGGSVAWVAGVSFLLFRVFDVLKPPPARQAESLPAGWGILIDDLVAGLYANLVGQVLWRLPPVTAWLGG